MKKILLLAALTLSGVSFAQTSQLGRPDAVAVDFGAVSTVNLSVQPAASVRFATLYGNVTVTERLFTSRTGGYVLGSLKVGNDWNDLNRLFVEGQATYTQNNLSVFANVRQGVLGDRATTLRLGTQVRF